MPAGLRKPPRWFYKSRLIALKMADDFLSDPRIGFIGVGFEVSLRVVFNKNCGKKPAIGAIEDVYGFALFKAAINKKGPKELKSLA